MSLSFYKILDIRLHNKVLYNEYSLLNFVKIVSGLEIILELKTIRLSRLRVSLSASDKSQSDGES